MHLFGFVIRMVLIICNYFLSGEELLPSGTERGQTMPGRSIVRKSIKLEDEVLARLSYKAIVVWNTNESQPHLTGLGSA